MGTSISHDELQLGPLDQSQSALVTERLPVVNPHLKFAEFNTRGYAVMEVHPSELRVAFRGVDTVARPTSPASTIARFRVRAGVPVAERTG